MLLWSWGARVSPAHNPLTGIQICLLPRLTLGWVNLGGWAEVAQEVDTRVAGGHVILQNVGW